MQRLRLREEDFSYELELRPLHKTPPCARPDNREDGAKGDLLREPTSIQPPVRPGGALLRTQAAEVSVDNETIFMKRVQSYSSISLYKKCPRAWEWRYVHKNYGPPNPSEDRGTELHALLEEFFMGGPYPSANKTLMPWQKYMEGLLKYEPTPEGEIAVSNDWSPCNYDDPGAYIKGKVDLTYTDDEGVRHILDWKSGRIYPDHPEQGKTYVAMDSVPATKYSARFVDLDLPVQVSQNTYTQSQRKVFQANLGDIIACIENDTTYEPTPSVNSCRYCELSHKRGGSCTRAQ